MFLEDKAGWYALFVSTNQEEKVVKRLELELGQADYRYVIPKRELKERKGGRWYTVQRKLFPGYILIHGMLTLEAYYKLKQIPDAIQLLRNEIEVLQIDEKELRILGILNKEDTVGISTLYKENDVIKVVEGPLVGLEGIIVQVNPRKGRAKVKINFLDEEKIVELGIQVVSKDMIHEQ